MTEQWKDIPDFVGYYQVSDFCRVKSLDRYVERSDGKTRRVKERILKTMIGSRGYLNVCLAKGGKRNTCDIHQLLAVTFLGHTPNGYKTVIDHINHNPLDNRLENLQLITHRKNTSKDKFRKTPSSKYIGVCWNKARKKWTASIRINSKQKHLGHFTDELAASNAYQEALHKIEKAEVTAATYSDMNIN